MTGMTTTKRVSSLVLLQLMIPARRRYLLPILPTVMTDDSSIDNNKVKSMPPNIVHSISSLVAQNKNIKKSRRKKASHGP